MTQRKKRERDREVRDSPKKGPKDPERGRRERERERKGERERERAPCSSPLGVMGACEVVLVPCGAAVLVLGDGMFTWGHGDDAHPRCCQPHGRLLITAGRRSPCQPPETVPTATLLLSTRRTQTGAHTHTHVYTHSRTQTRTHVYTNTHTNIYTGTHIHTRMHMHTQTYAHTHMHT